MRNVWVMAAVIGALVGCRESSGPEGVGFDADRVLADYRALDGLLEGAALRALGGVGTNAPSVGLGAAADGAGAPLISEGARGTTFVYDPALERYAPDPGRSGAPADGVRFILYAPGADGRPDVTRETGHADLIDLGPAGNVYALRLVAVQEGRTVLDYAFSIEAGQGEGTLAVGGYLQDAAHRLDFAVDLAGRERGADRRADMSFQLALDATRFTAEGEAHGRSGGEGERGEIVLEVRHGAHAVGVEATATAERIDAAFRIGGDLFATVKGPHGAPDVRGAKGEPLSEAEAAALVRIVRVTEDVFRLVEALVSPVEDLLRLGIVL